MHTATYIQIQRKLGLTGREYMEGFSSSDFDGLTQDERLEVIETLKARATKGDGISLDGLRQTLPINEFLVFAMDLLGQNSGTGLSHAQILTAVFSYTQSLDIWLRIIDALQQGDIGAQQWILNNVTIAELTDEWAKQLASVLVGLIAKETDKALLISEIVVLLKAKKLVPKSEEFVQIARRLQSADIQERRRALDDLGYPT